ncbi:heparan-alpha-glucosaminide N-acetyltransferase [Methanofollis fontis]|uniref:Heparan-alpha-glucosaminide N-acetyltransferase catalytic domain-containing protein n=1 Tax=Methanofollis fontis TaxID=2052832 RepID=A0A483CPS1_9EURY|nr:heparan-alpha-glucosaminide N-acetyltransferase [Methanofollis fontis]TAJ45032.1 hypothetical protein CUJ86_05280 [Methanofollis fontis]
MLPIWRWVSTSTSRRRFAEIDLVRGVAIVMMVIYHLLFDLAFLGLAGIPVLTGFWRVFALVTATLFIMLAGISLPISYARRREREVGFDLVVDYAKRGGKIIGFGVCASVATWIFLGEGFIVFGILHLIGTAIILAPFYLPLGRLNIPLGIGFVLAAIPLQGVYGPWWLIPFGIHPASFYSVDYVPIIPWMGAALIGVGIGSLLYRDGHRQFSLSLPENAPTNALCIMGRHSLAIYLVHQPLIVALLLAVAAIVR